MSAVVNIIITGNKNVKSTLLTVKIITLAALIVSVSTFYIHDIPHAEHHVGRESFSINAKIIIDVCLFSL